MPKLMRSWIASCVLLIAAFPYSVSGQDSTVNRPSLSVGDQWVVRTFDLVKNQETEVYEHRVTAVSGDTVELERVVRSSRSNTGIGQPSKRIANTATWTFISPTVLEGKIVLL